MAGSFDLKCRCGGVHLRVAVPRKGAGTRVTCYCVDCQAGAHALGAGEVMLDRAGGSDIYQTTPDLLEIVDGAGNLGILRLSPRGLFRWYATCCDTPLCNTLPKLGLPFVGIVLQQPVDAETDAAVGKTMGRVNTVGAVPGQGAPAKDTGFTYVGLQLLRRMITTALAGRAGKSPLRQPDGTPVAKIRVLSREERTAATPPLS